jgi:hypothetical protein
MGQYCAGTVGFCREKGIPLEKTNSNWDSGPGVKTLFFTTKELQHVSHFHPQLVARGRTAIRALAK